MAEVYADIIPTKDCCPGGLTMKQGLRILIMSTNFHSVFLIYLATKPVDAWGIEDKKIDTYTTFGFVMLMPLLIIWAIQIRWRIRDT